MAKASLFSILGLRERRGGAAEARPSAHPPRTDAARQWSGPLELADQWKQNEHVQEVIERRNLADGHHDPLRWVGADPAECNDIDHEKPEHPFVDRPKAGATHRRG